MRRSTKEEEEDYVTSRGGPGLNFLGSGPARVLALGLGLLGDFKIKKMDLRL
jgi:hypothetical protein